MSSYFDFNLPTMDQFVNITIASPSGDYNMSIVAKYFHQVPHKDIHFNWVNTTFDLQDNQYLEALGIIVAIPGFWLILTLLFFLIFFLCRCCDVNSRKKKSLTCCKFCLFLFTLFSLIFISVGIYGNYLSHKGVMKVQKSMSSLASSIDRMENLTHSAKKKLTKDIYANLRNLNENKINGPAVGEYEIVKQMSEEATKAMGEIASASQKIDSIDLFKYDFNSININLKDRELIRGIVCWAVLFSFLLIGFILMCGICRHSRCLLILFSVLGLLSLVICWVLTSIYIGFSVAVSDYCMDPKPFLYKQLHRDNNLINYYLECDDQRPKKNHYSLLLQEVDLHLENAQKRFKNMEKLCGERCSTTSVLNNLQKISNSTNVVKENLKQFNQNSDCSHVHQDYLSTMNYLCKNVLEGVTLMLASSATTGLIFTFLVLCASHTWMNIRKKRKSEPCSDINEETDLILPPTSASSTISSSAGNSKRTRDNYSMGVTSSRPRFSHTPPQTSHFPTGSNYLVSPPQLPPIPTNGRSIIKEEQLSFLTPPPSYDQVGPQQHLLHHHTQQGHQSVMAPHYVADHELLMRATQATKF